MIAETFVLVLIALLLAQLSPWLCLLVLAYAARLVVVACSAPERIPRR